MNDIARILDIKNPADITARLREYGYEEAISNTETIKKSNNQYAKFTRNVKETIVRESALLWICSHSRKPNADRLFRFVSATVIPSSVIIVGDMISKGGKNK